jgi:hypothetical protein
MKKLYIPLMISFIIPTRYLVVSNALIYENPLRNVIARPIEKILPKFESRDSCFNMQYAEIMMSPLQSK